MSETQVVPSNFQFSTLPKNKNQKNSSSSSSIDSLYEIEYVPGDRMPETTLPLVNPYEIFAKKPSFFSVRGVTQFIRTSSTQRVKEYVQASKFSSCQVPATEEEQFITLNIPEQLPRLWQQQGFTHLHFGVVRIGLTLHARKGLPVSARIALVDSRLKTYQQACIGTVQTTLNAGTIFVTLFPNFNVSLKDPNLLKALKVQLQIIGAPMQENSFIATLHHQMVYRVQDHALDLVLPSSDEALFLEVNSASQAPNAIQIPRQISREELIQKLPETWVTSYEKLHQAPQGPIQTSEATFHSRNDGLTEIKFEKARSSSFRRPMFTQFAIQIDDSEFHGPYKDQYPKPISFEQDGTIMYPFKDENGHCFFDVCNCTACTDDYLDYESDEDKRRRRRSKKDPLYKRYLEGDPSVGTLGDDNGKYEFIVQYSQPMKSDLPEIMMFKPSDFPPFEDFTKDDIMHSPKIRPTTVNPSGHDPLSQAEKVLNWQSENAMVQNKLLHTINHKMDQMASNHNKRMVTLQDSISEIKARLEQLHREMLSMVQHVSVNTSQFRLKEKEMTSLKTQLNILQGSFEEMKGNKRSTNSPFPSFGSVYPEPSYQGSHLPNFLPQEYSRPTSQTVNFLPSDEQYMSSFKTPIRPIFKTNSYKEKTRKYKEEAHQSTKKPSFSPSQSSQGSSHEEDKGKGKVEDIGMIDFSMTSLLNSVANKVQEPASHQREEVSQAYQIKATHVPIIRHLSDTSSCDSDTSTEDEKSLPRQFAIGESSGPKEEPVVDEMPDEMPNDEEIPYNQFRQFHEDTGQARQFASKVVTFTFDDIPFHKWGERLDEFRAWMTSEALTSPTYTVIEQFAARFTGSLKEWWNSLGDYVHLQAYQSTIPIVLEQIHKEFIGTPNHIKEQLQEEYFTAKCCSLQKKDLAKHFERQTKRYYALNGLNNPSLKQVYLSSIDGYLSQQTKTYIRDQNQTVEEITIGQIQQYVFRTLDKLCRQKEFWSEFMDNSKHLTKVCSKSDLFIKCSKKKKSCSCDRKKKHRETKRFPSKYPFRRKRFFRRKKSFRKTTKCFLCHKEGHFAKNCPSNSKKKKQYLINSISNIAPDLDLDKHDLESVLSYDSDEQDAICGYSDTEEEDSSSEDEEGCFKITEIPPREEDIQTPHLPVTIFDPEKKIRPVHIIAFIDTGAHTSIMNPNVLAASMWLPYNQEFRVANAGSLFIKAKSKPITIEIFPGCQITTQVLGSTAPGKDIILGWDCYQSLKKKFDISIEPRGVRWKNQFKPYTTVPRLFPIEDIMLFEFDNIKEEITKISCADSHSEFLQKCKNPLWLNPTFFVSLPFKENITTTPTKASHAGMPPALLQQAHEECEQLIQQGIVSTTNSPWACKAFYVNKRAEQARGKLRLVIDYKPLNQFLQDIKFPLPTRKALLQHLSGATIFSKFDLKSGFWQIGVKPEERHKTAFCLPDRHLEWKVLPFGLKTAPSLFQQAMLRIFQPLVNTALIYIDDILLFSKDAEDHAKVLKQFHDLVQQYGIMLAAKKMTIAKPEIEFLGVKIAEGKFTPQPHLATELLAFPDENLTRRQVQQFLGIINYVSEFIPKLSQLTQPLRKLLQKNPPQWSTRQTEAVKKLKQEIQKLPPLKIPSVGKRIVQTDASDKYWGAILFEEIDGKRHICAYKSGRFKESEMHYHSTFKEILAVKKAIERFEFYLIGHRFKIEMDMSSFPKMLQFNQKMVPHQQLLRWSEWFSKYDFESAYLKGKENILADMLSRKPVIPIFAIMSCQGSSSLPKSLYDFDNNIPEDAKDLIKTGKLHNHLQQKIFRYQSIILSNHGVVNNFITPLGIHPTYPFAHLFSIRQTDIPEEVICFLWYFCAVYTIGIIFEIPWLYQHINSQKCFTNGISTFLRWFEPMNVWSSKLRASAKALNYPFKKLRRTTSNPFFNPHTIYFFHRPVSVNNKSKKIHAMPTLIHHKDLNRGVRPDFNMADNETFEAFQNHAFRLNNTIQKFAIPYKLNWSFYEVDYQMDLDEDLQFYMMKQEQLKSGKFTGVKNNEEDNKNGKAPPTGVYWQDSQEPADPDLDLDLEEIEKFCTSDTIMEINEESEPEPKYVCPDDGYGCCEEHMLEFEMDH